MKKLFFVALAACFIMCATSAGAQNETKLRKIGSFEHLAVSLNTGTTGIGIEVATPLNPYLSLRGGFSMFPYTYRYDYDDFEGIDYMVPIKAKLNMYHGKLLVDFYPFRRGGIAITGGLMFAPAKFITVTTTSLEPIIIGDLEIEPDQFRHVEAWFETSPVKPYIGLSFGHAIPKRRVGFKCDLGVMFHGKPKVKTNQSIIENNIDSSDKDDFNKTIDKLSAYPYLNFQLSYRIF